MCADVGWSIWVSVHVYSCVCVSVCVHAFVGWYIGVHGHMFTGVYDYVKMSASMSG